MVRGLTLFMESREHCFGCRYKIDIKKEVENFKRNFPDVRPQIVFDFMACFAFVLDGKGDDFLNGGRQLMCSYYAKNFCEKFKELDVDLVFFLDGPIKKCKIPKYIENSNKKYESQKRIFSNITDGFMPHVFMRNKKLSIYIHNFFETIREYSKISISFANECDVDIANYATRVGALAVVTCDTDFLIFSGDWTIWLPNKFDRENLKMWCWNKKNLRKKLNLSQRHMPIFATLSGNDFVKYEYVQYLHEELTKKGQDPKPKLLAEYILKEFPAGVHLRENFDKLANILYNSGKNDIKLMEAKRIVTLSLNFYDYKMRKEALIEPWLKQYTQATNSIEVYSILKNETLTINQSWIDMSNPKTMPYSQMVMPVLRRQLGIILDHKRDQFPEREICFKPSHEEPFQIKKFPPIYYNKMGKRIADLKDLLQSPKRVEKGRFVWNNFQHIVPIEEKFTLLSWVLSPIENDLNGTKLLEFADNPLFVAILTLNYLVKLSQITVQEADIVLLSLNEALNIDVSKLICIKAPEKSLTTSFRISQIYNRLYRVFYDSLTICGLHPYTKISHFDGFIFGKMWQKFDTLDDTLKKSLIDSIKNLRIYL